MDIKDEKLKNAVAFHGHLCPGLLIGYRASLLGLETIGADRSEDEELVAVIENNSCSADAVQFLTGCTFGKGNLIFRDWGKQVFTFALRPGGRAVRIVFIGDRIKPAAPDGSTDRDAFVRLLIDAPPEDLFTVEEMVFELPDRARIFPTVPCARCGEGTMEPRLQLFRGRLICPACLAAAETGANLENAADFLFEVGMLKKTPRTGYQFLGNGRESVAAHSFRTAVIAWVLAGQTREADIDRTVQMALFHDLAEARTADHNYVNKQYVTIDEAGATRDSTSRAPHGQEIEALLEDFRASRTIEARLANDADQLDMTMELKEKKDLGNQYAGSWLFYAEKRLKTDVGRALFNTVLKTDWTRWWFDREEHLWVRND